jgi:hypothetical protein
LSIDPEKYRESLAGRWLGITFIISDQSSCVLQWYLPPENKEFAGLRGWLLSDKQIVRFEKGPKKSIADYVLWHRAFIPAHYELFLFNSSSWDHECLLLTYDTTEQDIIAFTGFVE